MIKIPEDYKPTPDDLAAIADRLPALADFIEELLEDRNGMMCPETDTDEWIAWLQLVTSVLRQAARCGIPRKRYFKFESAHTGNDPTRQS